MDQLATDLSKTSPLVSQTLKEDIVVQNAGMAMTIHLPDADAVIPVSANVQGSRAPLALDLPTVAMHRAWERFARTADR